MSTNFIINNNNLNGGGNGDDDILQEASIEQIKVIKERLKSNCPYALHAYYWLDNYLDWKEKDVTNTKVYCLRENGIEDGIFIGIEIETFDEAAPFKHSVYVFLFTLDKECKRLREALEKSGKIDWKKENAYTLFFAVHEDNQTVVNELAERCQLTVKMNKIGCMWWIPKEEAIQFQYNIPSDVYVAPLTLDSVDTIESVWPHRSHTSKNYLTRLLKVNGGFGIYTKDKNNTLCCWVLRNETNSMAILQTAEEHKRKGYAALLAKYYSKYWAEKGMDIFCYIMVHNKPSIALFEKLGFRREHRVIWTHCTTK